MRDLNYELKELCRRNRDGSFATQRSRARILDLAANQLHELGYRKMSARSLKPKHVDALVTVWRDGDGTRGWKALTPATIKTRMAAIRWWAQKVGKSSVVAGDNSYYGIPNRIYLTNENRSTAVDDTTLRRIRCPYVRASLGLQRAFGLRREEAIKFIPHYADRGDRLLLKDTWCKGGRSREVPIRTEGQRAALADAHRVAGRGALIPPSRNYVQQLHVYEKHTARAGLCKLHGLRHAYAQRRYEELTGWEAPAAGGRKHSELDERQRVIDREARLQISRELGHEREQVTGIYCGK